MHRLATHRFHLIEAGRYTGALAPTAPWKPDWALLNYLYSAGRDETEKWLARNRSSIGWRSTIDLADHFLSFPVVSGAGAIMSEPDRIGRRIDR